MKIYGSRDLGARLHQWHSGMDAVYGVGSMFYAGHGATPERVDAALSILRGIYKRRNTTPKMPRAHARELATLIGELELLREGGARSNPATRRAVRTSPFTVIILELDDHTGVARYIPRASTPQAAVEAAVEWADKAPFNGYEVIAVYPGVAPLIPEHEGGVFFEWAGGPPTRASAVPANGGGHTVLLFDLDERLTFSRYVRRSTTPRGAIATVERSLAGKNSRIENYDIVGVLHGENDPLDEGRGGLHFAYAGDRGR